MTISERHFSCPILSRLNLMSKPFNLKYLILFHNTFYQLKVVQDWVQDRQLVLFLQKGIRNYFLLGLPLFESYYFGLRKQLVHLTLKEIWIGFLSSECPLRNYRILIGKIYLWSCRRNEVFPTINSFIVRINGNYEIETYICTKNKSLQKLMHKRTL